MKHVKSIAAVCFAGALLLGLAALSLGCSSQSERTPKASGASSAASLLQAKGLLELDWSSIEAVIGGFGLEGFSFDTTDPTGRTPTATPSCSGR